ncbi:MAG: L-2-hydroxyglutarate oxidase, partial [Pseudomonadota bacterium]
LPNPRDLAATLAYSGFWRMAAKNWRSGLYELRGSLFKSVYVERCRKYCPELTVDDLEPWPTGIRAQAVSRDGALIDDFLLKSTKRSLHVLNAPSPAATSAFPIGDEIAKRMLDQADAVGLKSAA